MAEQYNSAFYGAEIDAAIAKAKSMPAYNADLNVDTATRFSGQLLHIADDGKVTPVQLGEGLKLENGVLTGSASGGSVSLDATLTIEGQAADAKAVGDAFESRVKRSNYTENDNTSPAYIQNRPFHDAWSSGVYAGVANFFFDENNNQYSHNEIYVDSSVNMSVGSEYTLSICGKTYTGVAMDITYSVGLPACFVSNGDFLTGDGATFAIALIDISAMAGQPMKSLVIQSYDVAAPGDYPFVISAGRSSADTVRMDEVLESYIGGLINRVSENTFTEADLANGCEFRVIIQDGSEAVFTNDDLEVKTADMFGLQVFHVAPKGDANIGVTVVYSETYIDVANITLKPGTYFLQDSGDPPYWQSAVSFKIPGTTIFEKRLPLKKLDKKYLPESVQNAASAFETTTTNEITWDGVVGDKTLVNDAFVHATDYAPDISAFAQGGTYTLFVDGEPNSIPVNGVSSVEGFEAQDGYMIVDAVNGLRAIVASKDNAAVTGEGASYEFPKKGVYFVSFYGDAGRAHTITTPLLEVTTTKIKKSALPDDIGGGASSWNDLTDKPFYSEMNEILNCEDLAFAQQDGLLSAYLEVSALKSEIVPNETYVVNWDGTDYTCTAQMCWDMFPCIGNGSILGEADTGEPFAIAYLEGQAVMAIDVMGAMAGEQSSTHSFTVTAETVKRIESKYVPSADWNAMAGETGNILNRPFGIVETIKMEFDAPTNETETVTINGTVYYRLADSVYESNLLEQYNGFDWREYNSETDAMAAFGYEKYFVGKKNGDLYGYISGYTRPQIINVSGVRTIEGVTISEGLWMCSNYLPSEGYHISELTLYRTTQIPKQFFNDSRAYTSIRLLSSTKGSLKQFEIKVDDSGTITATEVT